MDTALRAVACLRNRDEIKKFDEKEDCFILDFDPDEELKSFSNFSVSDSPEPDLHVVAEKGKVACRDYPHSRHACAKFRLRTMPYENHCEMCYCYVCDYAAPCKKWVGKARHCDAYDNEKWSIKRTLWREAVERKKEAYKGCPHPRYMCMEFPYGSTPHNNHCQLCFCYVCESAAPCGEWAGTSGHCHAFNNENWRTKRELKRYPTQGKVQEQEGNGTDERPEEPKLYVQNLSDTVTKHDLETFFKSAGVVKKSEVISVKSAHKSRVIGFVTMSTVEEAKKAVAMFDGGRHLFHGMALTVERCAPRCSPPAATVLCQIKQLSMDIQRTMKSKNQTWSKPKSNWVKLNVDASVLIDRNQAAVGGVLRDCKGDWIWGFGQHIPCASINAAQLKALQKGLSLAWEKRIHKIEIEMDSNQSYKMILGEEEHPTDLTDLVQQCRELLRMPWETELWLVSRNANRVADKMANLAIKGGADGFCGSPPPELFRFLILDKA